MHYRFVIDVPQRRSPRSSSEAVEELSKVMNGNPRERLLRQAAGAGVMATRRTTHHREGRAPTAASS